MSLSLAPGLMHFLHTFFRHVNIWMTKYLIIKLKCDESAANALLSTTIRFWQYSFRFHCQFKAHDCVNSEISVGLWELWWYSVWWNSVSPFIHGFAILTAVFACFIWCVRKTATLWPNDASSSRHGITKSLLQSQMYQYSRSYDICWFCLVSFLFVWSNMHHPCVIYCWRRYKIFDVKNIRTVVFVVVSLFFFGWFTWIGRTDENRELLCVLSIIAAPPFLHVRTHTPNQRTEKMQEIPKKEQPQIKCAYSISSL